MHVCMYQLHTWGSNCSGLADNRLILLLGVRLRHDESEDANSDEEDENLHFDDNLRVTKTPIVVLQYTNLHTKEVVHEVIKHCVLS